MTAPSKRRLIGPLLMTGDGASATDRAKLLYTVAGSVAVLVGLDVSRGITSAREHFVALFSTTFPDPAVARPLVIARQYMRCFLTQEQISTLADADRAGPRSIFRIWPDFKMRAHIDRSVSTVKADAAARSYIQSAAGTSTSTAEELTKLAGLRDQGVITDAEFAAQKAKVLS